MNLSVRKMDGGTGVVSVSGRLNAPAAPEFKAYLGELIRGGTARVVVDFSATEFIDSSGLSSLVSGLKTAREAGGYLRLVGLNEQTATVFKLTLLDRVFESFGTVEAALKA